MWWDKSSLKIHNRVTKKTKGAALQRFHKHVSKHFPGWAILHSQFLGLDTIRQKKITDIDVLSVATT
jgi:hypothetical protein